MLISLDYPLHLCVQHQFKRRERRFRSIYGSQHCKNALFCMKFLHERKSEVMIDLTYLRVEKIFKDQSLFEVILLK